MALKLFHPLSVLIKSHSTMLVSRSAHLRKIVHNRTVFSAPAIFNLNNRKYTTKQDNRSLVQAVADEKFVTLRLQNGNDVRYHHVWLRHHCPCMSCFDKKSKERFIDMGMIPAGLRPLDVQVESNTLEIVWEDGHQTSFEMSWLWENSYDGLKKGQAKRKLGSMADEAEMLLWNNQIITESLPPEFKFHDLKNDDNIVQNALNCIFYYGFTFINETPEDNESLTKICERIGGNIYNNVFDDQIYTIETNAYSRPDMGYSTDALPPHTDYSYFTDPAALHAMHIVHHEGTGGESLLIDGFFAAKALYKEDPESYKILTTTKVPFEFHSETHSIRVYGSILELDPFTDELMRIRFKNSRIGLLVDTKLSFEEMEMFYHAVRSFSSIVRRPENELWMKLVPGRVLVMDNRRTLHGRSAITGSRILKSCLTGLDDYMGRWRKNYIKKYKTEKH